MPLNVVLVTGAKSRLLIGFYEKLKTAKVANKYIFLTRSPKKKDDCFFDLMRCDLIRKVADDILDSSRAINRLSIILAYRIRENESNIRSIFKEIINLKKFLYRFAESERVREVKIILIDSEASDKFCPEQPLNYHLRKSNERALVRFIGESRKNVLYSFVKPGLFMNPLKKDAKDAKDAKDIEISNLHSTLIFLCRSEGDFLSGEIITIDFKLKSRSVYSVYANVPTP